MIGKGSFRIAVSFKGVNSAVNQKFCEEISIETLERGSKESSSLDFSIMRERSRESNPSSCEKWAQRAGDWGGWGEEAVAGDVLILLRSYGCCLFLFQGTNLKSRVTRKAESPEKDRTGISCCRTNFYFIFI
jgi:hypothetical protein